MFHGWKMETSRALCWYKLWGELNFRGLKYWVWLTSGSSEGGIAALRYSWTILEIWETNKYCNLESAVKHALSKKEEPTLQIPDAVVSFDENLLVSQHKSSFERERSIVVTKLLK